jgi:hypothetical protein
MTSAAKPYTLRRRPGLFLSLGLGAAAALALSAGCGTAPAPAGADGKDNTPAAATKVDTWRLAGPRLKRDTDFATCKSVLGGLRADAAGDKAAPAALTDAALDALSKVVPLSNADRDEIRGAGFTDRDAAYLADCFYLRDAARSLGVTGLPVRRRAELAFEWVCREVYLRPWLPRRAAATFATTALPPTMVLRRGSGSGLERMYVFLALAQQLGLDACLIGSPAREPKVPPDQLPSTGLMTVTGVAAVPNSPEALDGIAANAPRGPFWAVGVRDGADVVLFDPWRGQPFPVTLAQLRANPDAAKGWFEDKANLSRVTLDEAKQATPVLAVPVSALSPRMAAFEAQLKGELGVKVAIDPVALRAGFPEPKPAYWNPPADPFCYGRTARTVLPADQGGTDAGPSGERLFDEALRDQLPPPEAFKTPPGTDTGTALRLRTAARTALAVTFVEPPNPRERIQRGQFQEAAQDVVAKQGQFAGGLERLRMNKDSDRQISDWVERANEFARDVTRAGSVTRNADDRAAAVLASDVHWKSPGLQLVIDRMAAEIGQAEASFLLALCQHEQAERVQIRLERAGADEAARLKPAVAEAWGTAYSAWRTYERSSAQGGFPGRAAHAKTLTARAARFSGAYQIK